MFAVKYPDPNKWDVKKNVFHKNIMLLLNFKIFPVSSIKNLKYRKETFLKAWHSENLVSFQNYKNLLMKSRLITFG